MLALQANWTGPLKFFGFKCSSRFERVSTWGFKFGVDGYGQAQAGKCGQFNVFGQSTFFRYGH